ncbi:hypothetical protein FRC18_001702 [Serendipita sp. 400]|nr:hypothetical protein FRC18_001702 [Serendipita sp. 400]
MEILIDASGVKIVGQRLTGIVYKCVETTQGIALSDIFMPFMSTSEVSGLSDAQKSALLQLDTDGIHAIGVAQHMEISYVMLVWNAGYLFRKHAKLPAHSLFTIPLSNLQQYDQIIPQVADLKLPLDLEKFDESTLDHLSFAFLHSQALDLSMDAAKALAERNPVSDKAWLRLGDASFQLSQFNDGATITGVIAACYLAAYRLDAPTSEDTLPLMQGEEAVSLLNSFRPGSVTTEEQRTLIAKWISLAWKRQSILKPQIEEPLPCGLEITGEVPRDADLLVCVGLQGRLRKILVCEGITSTECNWVEEVWFDYPKDLCESRAQRRLDHPTLIPGPRVSTAISSMSSQLGRPPSDPSSEGFMGIAIIRSFTACNELVSLLSPPINLYKFPHKLDRFVKPINYRIRVVRGYHRKDRRGQPRLFARSRWTYSSAKSSALGQLKDARPIQTPGPLG